MNTYASEHIYAAMTEQLHKLAADKKSKKGFVRRHAGKIGAGLAAAGGAAAYAKNPDLADTVKEYGAKAIDKIRGAKDAAGASASEASSAKPEAAGPKAPNWANRRHMPSGEVAPRSVPKGEMPSKSVPKASGWVERLREAKDKASMKAGFAEMESEARGAKTQKALGGHGKSPRQLTGMEGKGRELRNMHASSRTIDAIKKDGFEGLKSRFKSSK